MAKKLIEAVCTANNGRSPVIERILRNRLIEIGASKDYDAISSGAMVEAISRGGFPITAMSPFVDLARKRGDIYDPQELQHLERALGQKDRNAVEVFYNQAVDKFVDEEHENRAEALGRYEIGGAIKTTRDQTVPRGDVVAVLPADRGNFKKVLGIYAPTDYTPTIAVLSQFATGNPNAEMSNAFGHSKDVYMSMVEQMLEQVPKAVDKIVGA